MHNFSAALTFWGCIRAQFQLNLSACKCCLRGSHWVHSHPLYSDLPFPQTFLGLSLDLGSTHPPLLSSFAFGCIVSNSWQTESHKQRHQHNWQEQHNWDGDFRKGRNLLSHLCHSKHNNIIPPILCFWALLYLTLPNPSLLRRNPSPNHAIDYYTGFVYTAEQNLIWLPNVPLLPLFSCMVFVNLWVWGWMCVQDCTAFFFNL